MLIQTMNCIKGMTIAVIASVLIIPISKLDNATAASTGAGTSGATFLKIDVGARPAAMAGAFTALADDVNTLHYNPAGLYSVRQPSISTMHAEWFLDINYEFIGLALPIGDRNTLGSSIVLLNTKDTRRGVLGTVLETFKIQDIAFTVGDGFKINDAFTVGLSAKYISQTLFHSTANAFAVDAGIKYFSPIPGFELGLSFQNLGTKLKFEREGDPLLHIFRFGAVYKILNDHFIMSGDLVKPRGISLQGNVGMEYNYRDLIYLRGGYRLNQNLPGADALSLGVGLKYKNIGFDYAFAPFGDLGNTHRFSGNLRFGKESSAKTPKRIQKKETKRIRKKAEVKQPEKQGEKPQKKEKIAMMDFTGDIPGLDEFNNGLFRDLETLSGGSILPRDEVFEKIIEAESMELENLPGILGANSVIFGSIEKEDSIYMAEVSIVTISGDIAMHELKSRDIPSLLKQIINKIQ